ncbi:MAG: hypothetical protein CMC51_03635 [Flavobacteriaceae bacterium]|nr:hypothetical protein [Flavobacteriaceae bacterium]
MKKIVCFILLFFNLILNAQINMPIDFENAQVTFEDFINFNGGAGYVVYNPQIDDENASESVGLIVRDGGDIWAGSYLELEDYLDFSTNTTLNMRVLSPYPGLMVKFKIEGDQGDFPSEPATERDAYTTTTNQWEILSWDFSGEPSNTYRKLVLMFDFGNIGDGTTDSTFYFDDIFQTDPSGGLAQIDLPVTFEDSSVYYSFTDFGNNGPTTLVETVSGNYARVEKGSAAENWAGVTIGTEAGFATNIPVTTENNKMYIDVYVQGSNAPTGLPIRLKIENSNDPTQSVETEAFNSVVNAWETLEFNFSNEAEGTAALNPDYPFDKASVFFNFGSPGSGSDTDGNGVIYYFDNVSFGSTLSIEENLSENYKVYPNPFKSILNIHGIEGGEKIYIHDILGKEIFKGIGTETINLEDLDKGNYFLVISKDGRKNSFKIIKK